MRIERQFTRCPVRWRIVFYIWMSSRISTASSTLSLPLRFNRFEFDEPVIIAVRKYISIYRPFHQIANRFTYTGWEVFDLFNHDPILAPFELARHG